MIRINRKAKIGTGPNPMYGTVIALAQWANNGALGAIIEVDGRIRTVQYSDIEFIDGTETNLAKDVAQFHQKFGLDHEINDEEWDLRHARLAEEVEEYQLAVEEGDYEKVFDAIIDIVYIVIGTAHRCGWDFNEGWRRVHAANMRKIRALSGDDSKHGSVFDIVKPEGWEAPNLADLVEGDE